MLLLCHQKSTVANIAYRIKFGCYALALRALPSGTSLFLTESHCLYQWLLNLPLFIFSIGKFFLTDPNEISCLIPVTKQWWGGEREVSYNLSYSAFPLSAEISLRNYRVPRSTVGEPVVYLMYWTLSFPKQHVISFCQYTLSFPMHYNFPEFRNHVYKTRVVYAPWCLAWYLMDSRYYSIHIHPFSWYF